MRRNSAAMMLFAIVLALGGSAQALINPNFTPAHLAGQAEMILLLKIGPADDKGLARAEVLRVLKKKNEVPVPANVQVLDFNSSANPEHAKAVRGMIQANGDAPALLFVGEEERLNGAAKGDPISKLHLGGKWVSLDKGQAANTWDVDVIDSHMEATWAGGTDMLLKITELVLKHTDIVVPSACGGSWDDPVGLGKVPGAVRGLQAVDIAGKGRPVLFVISAAGDKVFAYDAKARGFDDVTARLKLGSRSTAVAWGDFNGDGRLDLASSDGKALTLWSQGTDGSFSPVAVGEVPKEVCIGLAALDVGVKGRAGLVWSGKTGRPVVLIPDKDKAGAFALKPLAAGDGAVKDPAGPGACLVADFDGDGTADVLQPFAKGSVFYSGQAGAEFAQGTVCDVALGEGRTGAFLGDFDGDGRLDVFTVAEDSPRLWQNLGKGRFENMMHICGELTYISRPGCIGGNACDINNDGRQDVFLTYSSMSAQVFFNRGCRSFGHAHKPIDLAEAGNLPDALDGVQAGVMADFNGDGAQDMALVLLDGTVYMIPQTSAGDEVLALRVSLAPGGVSAGPVTVSAVNDRRQLGAWTVSPGTSDALFCLAGEAGEVSVTWQLPGGQPEKKTFCLDGKSVRFVIGGEKR